MARQRRTSRQQGQQPAAAATPVNPTDPARLEAVGRAMVAASAEAERLERLQRLLGRSLLDTSLSADQLGKAAAVAARQQESMARAARGATLAYAAFTGGLLAWSRAGLAGTTAGELLSFQQQQLSRQIASVFLPVIERYTEGLGKLVDWFRHLSGEQQSTISRWALFTAGVLGSALIVPRLTAAVGGLGAALKGIFLVNPFAGLTAAVVGLLAQTEEGRDSLTALGGAISEAFGGLAELLSGPVGAGLEGISRFLATAGGQFIAFSTIAVAALYRVAAAGQGAATAFLGWGTAIGTAILLVGGLITALGRSRDEAAKTAVEIEKALRAGRITPAEAREQLRQRAEEAAVEAEKVAREKAEKLMPEADRAEYIAEQGRKARERVLREGEEAIARGGKGRQDVVQARTGVEDPRATIRRLEASILRTDTGERTARATEAIEDLMRKVAAAVADAVKNLGGPPNPNAPAKED